MTCSLGSLERQSTALQYQVTTLSNIVDDLSRRRRNNLNFKGIPEKGNVTGNDTESTVAEFVNKNLKITMIALEREHRWDRREAG